MPAARCGSQTIRGRNPFGAGGSGRQREEGGGGERAAAARLLSVSECDSRAAPRCRVCEVVLLTPSADTAGHLRSVQAAGPAPPRVPVPVHPDPPDTRTPRTPRNGSLMAVRVTATSYRAPRGPEREPCRCTADTVPLTHGSAGSVLRNSDTNDANENQQSSFLLVMWIKNRPIRTRESLK